jgi:HEAT repeat protein
MWRRAPCALLVVLVAGCNSSHDKWIADLQSIRPEERAAAVKNLAEHFSADDLGLFTQAARDPAPIVRAEAMAALSRSPDPRVVDLLGEGLGDTDEQVQVRAATALADIRTDKARAYLTLQFGRRGRNSRRAIVQALKASNVPGAMASVVAAEATSIWERNMKALQSGSLPERVGAAEELGRSGRPEAVNRLVPLLKDNQVVLAAAAARGLGAAGDKRAVAGLTALLDENFPELREAACEALSRLPDPTALPKLAAVAQDKSPASPLATAAIIAMGPSPETDKVLCEVVMTGPGPEASAAGRERRRLGGCPTEPILNKLQQAASAPAALAAIAALGPSFKDKDAVTRVQALLTSSDSNTRRLAVDALVELGDPAGGPALLKAWDAELKSLEPLRADWIPAELPTKFARGYDPDVPLPDDDPTSVVRMRTTDLFRKVQALDEKRAREAGKILLKPLPPRDVIDDASEEQLKVVAALIRAMGRLKLDGARERVLPYAHESSPSLRSSAFAALASLGAEELALARPGLLDTERAVQSATAQALSESGPEGRAMVLEVVAQLPGDRSRLLESLRGGPMPKAGLAVLLSLVKEGGAEAGVAATLLGEAKAAEAVDPLLKVLEDSNTVARREVLVALGRIGDARAADTVGKDLYSDSAEVRVAAAETLATLGAGSHLEALDALKGDYYLSVRAHAQAAHEKLAPEVKK